MATITSRSLPLVPLSLKIALSNGDGSSIHQSDLNRIATIANHNISPRHNASPHSKSHDRLSSPHSRYSCDESPKGNILIGDVDRLSIDHRKNVMDDLSDARSSSVSSYQADSCFHREQDEDRMSCCSEDSELSVGKEVEDNDQRFSDKPEFVRRRKKLNENIDLNDDSVDEDGGSCSTPVTERTMLCGSEDVSNESSRFNQISSRDTQRDETVKFPIIRPSPTRLQEEFLRNSQLYAEEFMKHQMNFMAATKVLSLTPKLGDHSFGFPVRPDDVASIKGADDSKMGFRPHIRMVDKDQRWNTVINDERNSQSPDGVNFRGIHSHLNAISKITTALGQDMISITSPGSITSRESSQSPPHNIQQMINNNMINESNLKFSIDNILKPGFGRRITDPLLKRSKTRKNLPGQQRTHLTENKHGTPIDLTATTMVNIVSNTTSTATTTTTASGIPPTLSSLAASNNNNNNTSNNNNNNNNNIGNGNKQQDKAAPTSTTNSPQSWPAWVYCTRYSDRPSSGPRTRRPKKPPNEKGASSDEKRPRTAFSGPQLARLKHEFAENRYLTERRRQQLSGELGLNEAQIKIWFQNKRAKIKKSSGHKNPLALQLMAQGLYNHSTVPLTHEEEELQELQAQAKAGG